MGKEAVHTRGVPDLGRFAPVNEVIAQHFNPPFPARVAVGVVALPKGVPIEIDAIVHLSD